MEITKDTKLSDLLTEHPWLKDEIAKINERFKMLNSPVAKIMLGKATVSEMSKRSGMDIETIIGKIKELINQHK